MLVPRSVLLMRPSCPAACSLCELSEKNVVGGGFEGILNCVKSTAAYLFTGK